MTGEEAQNDGRNRLGEDFTYQSWLRDGLPENYTDLCCCCGVSDPEYRDSWSILDFNRPPNPFSICEACVTYAEQKLSD